MADGGDQPPSQAQAGGIAGALRRIAQSVLGLAQTRAELFAIELQEEKARAAGLLLWIGIAFLLAFTGATVAVGALAFFLWEVGGYAAVSALAVVLLGVAAAAMLHVRRQLLAGPSPFAGTVSEFRKDLECLRQRD